LICAKHWQERRETEDSGEDRLDETRMLMTSGKFEIVGDREARV
jgi:hypothetical protein